MGGKASGWAWDQAAGSPTQKLVLVAIADFINHGNEGCFAGLKTLGEMTQLNRRTIQRAIRELEELRLVETVARRDGDRQTSNLYRMAYGDGGTGPPSRAAQNRGGGGTGPPPGAAQDRPIEEPPEEPPNEPPEELAEDALKVWADLAGRYPNILQISELKRLEKHCGTEKLVEQIRALFRNGSRSMDVLTRRVIENWETDPLAKKEPDEGEAHPTVDELIKKGDL